MGSTFDCADHSKSVCLRDRSMISWPDMAGLATVVVIDSSLRSFITESQRHREEQNLGRLLQFQLFRDRRVARSKVTMHFDGCADDRRGWRSCSFSLSISLCLCDSVVRSLIFSSDCCVRSLELAAVLFGPAFDYDLLVGVELD